jgi:hypothetical protein
MLLVLERIIIKVSGFLLDTSKAMSPVIQRYDWLSRRLIASKDELPLILGSNTENQFRVKTRMSGSSSLPFRCFEMLC